MYIAKNATHHYTSWWFIRRMADFDYTASSDPDMEGHSLMQKVDRLDLPAGAQDADANVCLELSTTDAETDCYFNSQDSSEGDFEWDDDDDNVSAGVGLSALLFSVFGFLAIVLFGVLILKEVRKRNREEAAAALTHAATAVGGSATTNELHKDNL